MDYITNKGTLKDWVGLSLVDRCKYFHRQFPEKKLNPTMLTRIYKKFGIKKRAIRYTKSFKPEKVQQYQNMKEDMVNKIREAK